MAWIAVDLYDTLVSAGDEIGTPAPIPGAPEAMQQLAAEGHRLTVFTSAFAPMPLKDRQMLKEQITEDLNSMGFPPMEVWTGTTKPDADIYLSSKAVNFDNDWPLGLAQIQYMLEERGLVPSVADGGFEAQEEALNEDVPEEGQ